MIKKRIFLFIVLAAFVIGFSFARADEEILDISDEESAEYVPGRYRLSDRIEDWRNNILKKYGTDIAFLINTQYQKILQSTENEGKDCWAGKYDLVVKQKLFLQDFYLISGIRGGEGRGIDKYTPVFSGLNDADGEPCWLYVTYFYLEKRFLDNKTLTDIGKLDLSSWFDENRAANSGNTQFLSSTFVNNRAIPFPSKGFGARAFIQPNDLFYCQAGISNANAVKTKIGLSNAFSGAYFIMSEFGMCPRVNGQEGNYRFMLFGDVEKLQRIDGRGTQQNDMGFAMSFDQNITENIILFFRYGNADPDVRKISGFLSAGAQFEGVIPGRTEEVWGVGAARSFISGDYRNDEGPGIGNSETIYETYYNIKLFPFVSVIPNIQYVTDPQGREDADNEITAGVRFVILV